jgi:AraC-like DNA-binding protein
MALHVRASTVRLLARVLAPLGAKLDEPLGDEPIDRVAAALDRVAVSIGLPHVALEIAARLPLGALGAADYCFSTTATLIDALAHLPALLDEPAIVVDRCGARIVFWQRSRIAVELAAAFVVRRLRDVIGDDTLQLTAVRFTHALAGSVEPYRRWFGARVTFGAAADEIAIPRHVLDTPLLTADATLAAILVDRSGATPQIVGRVRTIVTESLARQRCAPSVDAVARRLALSSRSLQRRLHEAGAAYSTIVDDARRGLASTLLARDGAILHDVASRLGFAGVAAFFRAFRRWTGASPRAYQRALLAPPAITLARDANRPVPP